MAKLGGGAAKIAAEKLIIVAAELAKSGVTTAERRIRDIDAVVDSLPFPVVERLVAPDRVLAELDDVQARPVRELHSLRNQTALLPLVLTWLSIGFAVMIHGTSLLVPVYSTVAVVDAVLIGTVVALTRAVHSKEQAAAAEYYRIAEQVDAAMKALAIAMAGHAASTPENPEDWAVAAREVLEETRKQTAELFESTTAAVDKASENLASVHTETEKLVGLLAEQSGKTLDSLRQANEQMVARVAKEAVDVLNSAVAEDRALVSEHLAPLIEQFQANVESFTRGFDAYQEDISAFVAVTSDVGVATKALGESAASYTDTAESIDTHLRSIESSQQAFIENVTESARNMGTAAGAMETMSKLLSDRLRADLETITRQLTSSSAGLAAVDTNLVQTTDALGMAADRLQAAAAAIGGASAEGRRWFRRR
ncbi:hypothetical protein GCM10022254_32510 [Actinomadura meridiana]|uniref:Methyl-accepting chemotaxis protein n=1 Tax=Actinomadura meridiana TaxID=559626 RepID=A0ABP8C2I7_9ACTN